MRGFVVRRLLVVLFCSTFGADLKNSSKKTGKKRKRRRTITTIHATIMRHATCDHTICDYLPSLSSAFPIESNHPTPCLSDRKMQSTSNAISQLKRSADIETNREKLEELAATRAELKTALHQMNEQSEESKEENSYFTATTSSTFSSSFFRMNGDDAELMMETKLKSVEKEIVELCSQVQRRLGTGA